MFASVDEGDPAAAWFKRNDPIGGYDEIRRLVAAGFLVRTRADADTRQARDGSTAMRDRALASGAQFVSTDYPVPDPRFTDYCVRLPGGVVARANPVVGPPGLNGVDLEQIDAGMQPDPPRPSQPASPRRPGESLQADPSRGSIKPS